MGTRYRVDDGSNKRANQSSRGSLGTPVNIIRTGFVCKYCGHRKEFSKAKGKECCSCKRLLK